MSWLSDSVIQSILTVHPNDAASPSFVVPPEWLSWWDNPPSWQSLLHHNPFFPQPPQLSRHPIHIPTQHVSRPHAMSPKKHHEVTRMTDYILHLLRLRLPHIPLHHIRIVDVGAGQGYITRALHDHLHAHILALDADYAQTSGAKSRGLADRITHHTVHITPTTLIQAIDDWIPTTTNTDTDIPCNSTSSPIPVLLVALHACGSLTPDIFRAFLHARSHPSPLWYPVAVVAVGCCYNLMHPPPDFPLSASLSATLPFTLPTSSYHLAAQIPSTWSASSASLASAALSIRKVAWRALLTRLISSTPDVATTGSTPAMRRLGRLNDAAYATWDTFIRAASAKIGLDLSGDPDLINSARDPLLERRLEVLHVLRCLLGPPIESLIILDRVAWLKEALRQNESQGIMMQVDTVNLFDQATGSGRNVAIVLAPPAELET